MLSRSPTYVTNLLFQKHANGLPNQPPDGLLISTSLKTLWIRNKGRNWKKDEDQILDMCACLKMQRFWFRRAGVGPMEYAFKVISILDFFFLFWLHWVFVAVHGLSLVAASRGYSLLWCAGFSLRWLLLLWSTGSRHTGFSSCGTWAQ